MEKRTNAEQLPDLQYPNVYIYLVNTSYYTKEAIKAYKSLHGYKSPAGFMGGRLGNVSEKEGARDVPGKYQPIFIINVTRYF